MKKFDQYIQDNLSQPQTPPLGAWKNIQEKLDEKEKKKRIIPLFYWIGSTAACLILGVGVYYFYQNDTINSSNKIPEIVHSKKKNQQETDSNTEKDFNEIESIENKINADRNIEKFSSNSVNQFVFREENNLEYQSKKSENINLKNDHLLSNDAIFSNVFATKNPSNFTKKTLQESLHANVKKEEISKTEENNLKENELELAIAEQNKKQENKIEIKQTVPKFAVSSFVNPSVLLDSKSILSDEFNQNDIENAVTLAYGAKVSFKINDKLNIRSGIAKVNLEQQTNQVNTGLNTAIVALSAHENASSQNTNNINYNSNIRVNSSAANSQAIMAITTEANKMEQKIQYIEVPLELEYKLLTFDKFNVLATAGGSYYIVTKNTISVNSSGTDFKIGKATNLNNTSYSANAGLKLEYMISNKTSLNFEPNYRYMLNPLKNVDAKNPSLLGANLGFSIKF